MAFQHVYQVVISATLRSQQVRNVFYYRDLSENVPSSALAEDLRAAATQNFLPSAGGSILLDDIFSSEITYTGTEVQNLSDPTILASALFTRSPGGLADLVSPFAAIGFRTARVRTDIRRGQKRFAGVTDTSFVNGEIVPGILTTLDSIASALENDIQRATDPLSTWRQIIVGRIKYTTPSGTTAYRLPESDAELRFFDARPWEVNVFMTTQNTRKVGRGV